MAGRGARFGNIDTIKPLIDVAGEPMFKRAVDTLDLPGRLIFCLHREHVRRYGIDAVVLEHYPEAEIVIVDDTAGPADTCIQAVALINNDDELVIANCDQYMTWNPQRFLTFIEHTSADGIVVCYPCSRATDCFVRVDDNDVVDLIVEKRVISDIASNGIHWWRHGRDFIRAAQTGERAHDGEPYVCPTYNAMIKAGSKVVVYRIPAEVHHAIGIPEDLELFLEKLRRGDLPHE
jgi:NDP-sugar pyrophosphorylase family protein